MKFIDEIMDKALKDENKKYWITLIMLGLILGQIARVGIYEYNSATRVIENEKCVTVNDEYYLRATKGLNYSYNQLSTEAREKCLIQKHQPFT